MIFVIGDIHGEINKLSLLISRIEEIDSAPSLIFIGDYIDKGTDPKTTLSYLSELSLRLDCTFLMGNHEYYWLLLEKGNQEIEDYLLKYGGSSTMESFKAKNLFETKKKMLDSFKDFFEQLIPFWQNDRYLVVHSGVSPSYYDIPIEEIPIENLLFNRYDFISQERLFQNSRKIIFGHTGFYTPFVDDYKIGIDTGAYFLKSQPLTAFCLEEEFFINSQNATIALKSIPSGVCPNIPRIKPSA